MTAETASTDVAEHSASGNSGRLRFLRRLRSNTPDPTRGDGRRRRGRTALGGILLLIAAGLLLSLPSGAFSSSGPPTIASNQADYAPGSTVTLTGANWQSGESVHIDVNDNVGQTWSYSTDVV